jgi:uncharacterized damage-inducible protein DinB
MVAAPFTTLLDEAIELWSFTRDGVIAEAEAIPPGQFDWRPAPESRTVTELVQHIVESGAMAAGELTRADGDFQRVPYPTLVAEYASGIDDVSGKDALLRLLRDSHDDGVEQFRNAGEIFMFQTIRRFDGIRGTRLAWLYHLIDHESYHRGQLALYVRQLGYVPALTKLIYGS